MLGIPEIPSIKLRDGGRTRRGCIEKTDMEQRDWEQSRGKKSKQRETGKLDINKQPIRIVIFSSMFIAPEDLI
jgi:hypothetical protein